MAIPTPVLLLIPFFFPQITWTLVMADSERRGNGELWTKGRRAGTVNGGQSLDEGARAVSER